MDFQGKGAQRVLAGYGVCLIKRIELDQQYLPHPSQAGLCGRVVARIAISSR